MGGGRGMSEWGQIQGKTNDEVKNTVRTQVIKIYLGFIFFPFGILYHIKNVAPFVNAQIEIIWNNKH